jgi:hypothetical protein
MSVPVTSSNPNLMLDKGPQIKVVAILFLALTWVSVIARCSVRIFMNRLFRIDDWLAIATLVRHLYYFVYIIIELT